MTALPNHPAQSDEALSPTLTSHLGVTLLNMNLKRKRNKEKAAEKKSEPPPILAGALDTPQIPAELSQLQIAKLRYEIGLGRRLEIVKGVLSLFTAAGVIFTVYLGMNQQRQAAAYRNDDRFDRSIGRLSSHEPTERLAGLAGIQQFLYLPDMKGRSPLSFTWLTRRVWKVNR